MFRSWCAELHDFRAGASLLSGFDRRQRLWGRWKLRPGLPPAVRSEPELNFYRLLLERGFAASLAGESRTVWDIGCRNWSYAPALTAFFPRARLIGVEVDAGRRYWNLHRRGDAALSMVSTLGREGRDCRFLARDFLEITECPFESGTASPVFCFFFPFVSVDPCRSWGLPRRFARFSPLLDRALSLTPPVSGSVRPWILSAHQGEWEAELARQDFRAVGLAPREIVVPARDFAGIWPSTHAVHLFRADPDEPAP